MVNEAKTTIFSVYFCSKGLREGHMEGTIEQAKWRVAV